MKLKHTFALSSLALAVGSSAFAQDVQQDSNIERNENSIQEIKIIGIRADRISQGATGLTMAISETPQSISILTAEQIENFGATNLNDALRLASGINVEEWETNRTNYTSRGFEIKNTQIDGVGMPNDWGIVTGAMDVYGYEKIEVIRGANGLLTGVGNSAGTINYVRKRPTNETEGEITVSVGSYDFKRIEADYSTRLTEDGSWAARVVAAVEDKESYLDGLSNDRKYFYGVIDGQLTNNSTLTAGFSYQEADTDGNMWGGLIFNYTDGTQAEWDTSASTTQEWTMWDTINTNAFIEYAYLFDNGWEVKATYNRRSSEEEDKLFYAYGTIDKDTGLGLTGWPGRYDGEYDADLFDLTVVGEYSLFGKSHEIIIGASTADSAQVLYQHPFDSATTPALGPAPAFPYALDAVPEPVWLDIDTYADLDVTLTRFFGSTKLNITDNFFVVAGFNSIKFTREGINSGVVIDNEESETSPYIGATFGITDDINAYVSYSDIYQPQEEYDYDGYFLAPTKGINIEAGIKTEWFDKNLLATFAVFSAEQDNLASFAGYTPTFQYYYEGINVESKGFEIELVGHITENLNAVLAYTALDMEDDAGAEAHEWQPRNTVQFLVDYTFPKMPELKFGIGGRWQSDIRNTEYSVEQGSYLLVNAFARWDITDKLNVQANINNLTDEKYINSLYVVGYYGSPTNGAVSLAYSF